MCHYLQGVGATSLIYELWVNAHDFAICMRQEAIFLVFFSSFCRKFCSGQPFLQKFEFQFSYVTFKIDGSEIRTWNAPIFGDQTKWPGNFRKQFCWTFVSKITIKKTFSTRNIYGPLTKSPVSICRDFWWAPKKCAQLITMTRGGTR